MDIDKIISAYECVITRGKSVCECGKCDYHIKDSAVFFCDNQRVLTDTLSLLKEQNRSKHGHWVVLKDCSNAGVYCSECNTKMFDMFPMKKKLSQYCGHCGAHNDLQMEVR